MCVCVCLCTWPYLGVVPQQWFMKCQIRFMSTLLQDNLFHYQNFLPPSPPPSLPPLPPSFSTPLPISLSLLQPFGVQDNLKECRVMKKDKIELVAVRAITQISRHPKQPYSFTLKFKGSKRIILNCDNEYVIACTFVSF